MKLRDRQGKIPVELTENMSSATASADDSKHEHIEKDMALSFIEEGLVQLNDDQKVCVTLFYLQKKSYQQITNATGFTMLQVKSFIQNGKRNLRLFVEKKMKLNNG